MKIHILGICGTFMGGIALLAKQAGHEVSGSDQNVYPPMSTQLKEQGISLHQGYEPESISNDVEQVVVGNVMSRGNEAVEHVLNKGIAYASGPRWLADHVLRGRWVLAVAGTHGKTTTASMLAWILEYAGLEPGFLIGGVPVNFDKSARYGNSPFFVVEADEYDTAFFDKRSKFVHYSPKTLILNNLEFDHADIFENLDEIKTQFHNLIRIVPGKGLLIVNQSDQNLKSVLEQGSWTRQETFSTTNSGKGWSIDNVASDGSTFNVLLDGEVAGSVSWSIQGSYNRLNALAAISAARHVGVPVQQACDALLEFKGIKRRMELRGKVNDVSVYDDFAHHPTAITETLAGLREKVGKERIIAVLEPRSNTMKRGVHKDTLAESLQGADKVLLYNPADISWNIQDIIKEADSKISIHDDVEQIVQSIIKDVNAGDNIVIMSNGGFDSIHDRLLKALKKKLPEPSLA